MIVLSVKNLYSKVHNGLNWDLRKGEIHGIIGPSGQGKSFFMKIILNLLPKISGEILDENGEKWDPLLKKIGVQFQYSGLIGNLTVGQNIMLPLRIKLGMSEKLASIIARKYMEKVKLDPKFFPIFPVSCSGGMQKRAALARALVLEPSILFLDEPTAGLDPIVIETYDELLKNTAAEGTSIVMITHDLARLKRNANRISIILDGIFYTGTFEELANHSYNKVREFLESYVRTVASF